MMEYEQKTRSSAAEDVGKAITGFQDSLGLLGMAVHELEAVDAGKTPMLAERAMALQQLTQASQQLNAAASQLHLTFAAWKEIVEAEQQAASSGARLLREAFSDG